MSGADKPTSPAVSDLPSGRGAGLLVIALLATVAIALAFVDATGAAPDDSIETRPGFYALAGLAASVASAMLARLLRIILGRTNAPGDADSSDAADRA